MQFNIWILLLYLSALMCGVLAIYASRQIKARGSFELALLLAAVSIWALCEGMVSTYISIETKLLWTKFSYIGSQTTPVFFLLFVLRYTNNDTLLRNIWNISLFFIIPLTSIIIAFVDEWNVIIWASIKIVNTTGVYTAVFEHGVWFYLEIIYSYILLILGFVFLYFSIFYYPTFYSRTTKLLLISPLIPFLFSVFYVFNASLLGGIDPTPIMFSLSSFFFVIAIVRFGFLDITPIAKDSVVENMLDGVLILDLKNRIIDINKAACQILQIDKKCIGSDISALEKTHKYFVEFCLSDKNEISEMLSDYGNLYLNINASMLKNKKGLSLGRMFIIYNITERKLAEEKIKQQNLQLQLSNAEKDKFFSIISHDLRSPLGAFMSLTEMMSDDSYKFDYNKSKELTTSMSRSARNLFNLLENLLEWSMMKRGMTTFAPENLNLSQVICASTSSLFESAKIKGINFNIDITNEISVFADANMLGTLIRNLVSNAIKFTAKDGKITVSAHFTSDNFVEITVKDTGIGMNKKLIDNLFNLDVNTKRTGTDGELSTGLGLMLCKEFVEKNKGKLWFESEEGKGSIFFFTLPAVNIVENQ